MAIIRIRHQKRFFDTQVEDGDLIDPATDTQNNSNQCYSPDYGPYETEDTLFYDELGESYDCEMASVEVIPIASVTDTRRFDLLPMANRGFGSPGEVDDGCQGNFREGERPIRWEKGAEEVKKTSLKPSSELSPRNSQKGTSAISTVTDVFTEMTLNSTLPQTSQIGKGVTELTEWNPGDVTPG